MKANRQSGSKQTRRPSLMFYVLCVIAAAMVLVFLTLPTLVAWKKKYLAAEAPFSAFPVTVDPKNKTIAEDPKVDAMLNAEDSSLAAAAITAGDDFDMIASAIASTPFYQLLSFNTNKIIDVNPGYRKEEVANAFGNVLGWDTNAKKAFMNSVSQSGAIPDGVFFPDTYVVTAGTSDAQARALIADNFQSEILSHYGTTTADIVPLSQALTIASMLERETKNKAEMRLISGIIWNRIFAGMKLQIDATLQYAKATKASTQTNRMNWWPKLTTNDKYISSPYNTYQNTGLPPGPISNPSVAAVLAALNPKKTSCLFYFHDKLGAFHCSDTYSQHVALLKEYYGRGK